MKRILGFFLLLTICGLLVSSVNAADLQTVEFHGFTLDVPGDNWKYVNAPYEGSSNGEGVTVAYFTSDKLYGLGVDSFQSFFDKLNEQGYELTESKDNMDIYQRDDTYLVTVYDDDELFIIEDKNSLDEAKAIAESAELKSSTSQDNSSEDEDENETQESTSNNSSPFENYFTMNTPKDASFEIDDEYEKINNSNVEEVYQDQQSDLRIFYAESDNLDEYKDHFNALAKNYECDIETDGNLTIIYDNTTDETSVYLFSDDKVVGLDSFIFDADALKDMANSVEFKE